MRVDKYLWCVRYYKTRSLATTACKKGHIRVNNAIAKPSREVFAQDTIEIRLNQIKYQITVNDLPESRVGAKLVDIYRVDHTPKEQFEAQELLKYAKDYYREKGVGRPTKKDRRDIEDFKESAEDDD